MEKVLFGKTKSGMDVHKYTVSKDGITFSVLDYGATLYSLIVPDKKGNDTDVILAPKDLCDIEEKSPYMGATVGRYANRIGGGKFEINGKEFTVSKNEGENSLHGGIDGFDKRIWNCEKIPDGLKFTLESPDGDQGFPGNLKVTVFYIIEDNGLNIEYFAVSDKDTVANFTNHSYFNVNGHNSGNLLNHTIMINSDYHIPVDEKLIPTGEIRKNEGTIFDLKEGKKLTEKYDHCFVINDFSPLKYAGYLEGDKSGIKMSVYTTKPGIQIYCAKKFSKEFIGKHGDYYPEESFVCMETEFFPDSPNNPHFSDAFLKAGEYYKHKTIYKFS